MQAAFPSTSSVLTGHRDREGLSLRRPSAFSNQACEQGKAWKISPDFKIVEK